MADCLSVARAAFRAGLCVLPADVATKTPAVPSWREYQQRSPTADEWKQWQAGCEAVGVICGFAGVEAIDFDLAGAAFATWAVEVERQAPGLLDRCYIERSPSGGKHVVFRCDAPEKNSKLTNWYLPWSEGTSTHERAGVSVTIHGSIGTNDVRMVAFGDAPKQYKAMQIGGQYFAVAGAIETRGLGGWLVVAPSAGYQVDGQVALADMPQLTAEERAVLITAAQRLSDQRPGGERQRAASKRTAPRQPKVTGDTRRPGDRYADEGNHHELLTRHGWAFDCEKGDNEHWTRPGKSTGTSATWNESKRVFYVYSSSCAPLQEEQGYSLFDLLTQLEYNGDATAAAAALAAEYRGSDVRHLHYQHRQPAADTAAAADDTGTQNRRKDFGGPGGFDDVDAGNIDDVPDQFVREIPDQPPRFELNEHGNAQRFFHVYGDRVLFCHTWSAWLTWQGTHWEMDKNRTVQRWIDDAINTTCAAEYEWEYKYGNGKKAVEIERWRIKNRNDRPIKNSLERAAAIDGVSVLADDLDFNEELFSVRNGTINLRTGKLQKHDPADRITRLCDIEFDFYAQDDRWMRFLNELTGNDVLLQGFLARAAGYSMSGDVGEQGFFFITGPGGTGKSTFVQAIGAVMGTYHSSIPFEAFLNDGGDHKWTFAKISKMRLVSCEEAPEGKQFDSHIVKRVTGDSVLEAQHKFGHPFDYRPKFKIWMVANDLPAVQDTDSGFWRRLRMVRCDHKPKTKDKDLLKHLTTDPKGQQAVLAWMVRGSIAYWENRSLEEPECVQEWSHMYRKEQDPIGDFLAESTIWGDGNQITRGRFRAAYAEWCQENGARPLGAKNLFKRLRGRGASDAAVYDTEKGRSVTGFAGLRLRHDHENCRPDLVPNSGEYFNEATDHDGVKLTHSHKGIGPNE
jgi:putative DNA primase/helicase